MGAGAVTRLRIGHDTHPPVVEQAPDVDATTRDQALAYLAKALTEASGEPIEQHKTAFGQIVVAKLMHEQHLAFAIEAKLPMSALQSHHINRTSGTTEPAPASAPEVPLGLRRHGHGQRVQREQIPAGSVSDVDASATSTPSD